MASWSVLAVAVLLLAPAATARSLDTPLSPQAVSATLTASGVVVEWLPPLFDGGHPVETYTVYRLAGLKWTEVGSVPAEATSLLDPTPLATAIYHVTASNQAGPSPASEPAVANTPCEPVGISVDFDFPFVHPGLNPDCIGPPVRFTVLWRQG